MEFSGSCGDAGEGNGVFLFKRTCTSSRIRHAYVQSQTEVSEAPSPVTENHPISSSDGQEKVGDGLMLCSQSCRNKLVS